MQPYCGVKALEHVRLSFVRHYRHQCDIISYQLWDDASEPQSVSLCVCVGVCVLFEYNQYADV